VTSLLNKQRAEVPRCTCFFELQQTQLRIGRTTTGMIQRPSFDGSVHQMQSIPLAGRLIPLIMIRCRPYARLRQRVLLGGPRRGKWHDNHVMPMIARSEAPAKSCPAVATFQLCLSVTAQGPFGSESAGIPGTGGRTGSSPLAKCSDNGIFNRLSTIGAIPEPLLYEPWVCELRASFFLACLTNLYNPFNLGVAFGSYLKMPHAKLRHMLINTPRRQLYPPSPFAIQQLKGPRWQSGTSNWRPRQPRMHVRGIARCS
jgi:hypothetical protein